MRESVDKYIFKKINKRGRREDSERQTVTGQPDAAAPWLAAGRGVFAEAF